MLCGFGVVATYPRNCGADFISMPSMAGLLVIASGVKSSSTIAARWTWQWPSGPNEVKGYPAIVFGQKPGYAATPGSGLPRRLDGNELDDAKGCRLSASAHGNDGSELPGFQFQNAFPGCGIGLF